MLPQSVVGFLRALACLAILVYWAVCGQSRQKINYVTRLQAGPRLLGWAIHDDGVTQIVGLLFYLSASFTPRYVSMDSIYHFILH